MVQWALYLDESGHTGPHALPVQKGQTPVFTLAGVILPFDRWREYDRDYLYLKRDFFGAEIERSSKDDTAWEVKGSDLNAPRNASSERNKVFTYKVLDMVRRYGGSVIGVTFIKSIKSPLPPTSLYTKALQIIAERFNLFLRDAGGTGIMIVDSRMAHTQKGGGLDYSVAKSYLSFVFGNAEGKQLKQIMEAPLFADSKLTAGLQIADIIASIVSADAYQERLAPDGAVPEFGYLDYTHVKRYKIKAMEFVGQQNGRKIYGLRVVNHYDGPDRLLKLKQRFDS